MIGVIAADDEQLALRRTGQLLESLEGMAVLGLFDRANALLDYALTASETIHLALLDMEMPGMHGLELARRLKDIFPEIQIVFLTAHDEYARDAFEVEALDYLLKPATLEDMEKMRSRYGKRTRTYEAPAITAHGQVSVRSMGPFSVAAGGGEPLRFRNSKSRELLAYLHAHEGKPVSKAQIMDALWFGRDIERTQANLHTTVYQLRKDMEAIGLGDAIEHARTAGGSYMLRWKAAFDDIGAYAAERRLYKETRSLGHLMRAVTLYGNGYLAGSGYEWAAPRQAELEIGYIDLLEDMVGVYVRQQRYEIALNPMQTWAQLMPLSGRLHAKMIALLLLLGREEDARDYCGLAQEWLEDSEEAGWLDIDSIIASPAAMFAAAPPLQSGAPFQD
ncbi:MULTISPECIES: response regulator [unclassified Paenibacillus]|uniref:response regulator n=1 Tax=unclassified Paenibacillus TaxID=185978 RepID=UPI0009546807|nr:MULTISPECIES: response regulator [unclassified Paenibacillus]ASS65233.1 response regulator [Paenibacillus sp. RUD330]SIQ43264.1 Two-component response regulator, SAPR family, consists of REC, wHTH and BTAD domains [Paenibacillus sp. RU4X]SIQ65544.1 Two-component response regulator, SAPR family, consists of REC, wHTH and BTAD domains [Paenibacillus sp. RU4T]